MMTTLTGNISLQAPTIAARIVTEALHVLAQRSLETSEAVTQNPEEGNEMPAGEAAEEDFTEFVAMSDVRIDGETQARVKTNDVTVEEYAEVLREGVNMPPIVLYYEKDANAYWLADGFHRFYAHRAIGRVAIWAVVKDGTRRDARLHAASANATHGLPRTNEDKRCSVMMMLDDPEWATWSDNKIAKICNVSHPFVAKVRAAILKPLQDSSPDTPEQPDTPATRTVTRNGTTYEQKVRAKPTATPVSPKSKESPLAAATADALAMDTTNETDTARLTPAQSTEICMDMLRTDIAALREELAEVVVDAAALRTANDFLLRISDADDQIKAALDDVARYKALAEKTQKVPSNTEATVDPGALHAENAQLRAENSSLYTQLQDRDAQLKIVNMEKDALADELGKLAAMLQEAMTCHDEMRAILKALPLAEMPSQLHQALELVRMFESRVAEALRRYADAQCKQDDVMYPTEDEAFMNGKHYAELTGTESIECQPFAADGIVQAVDEGEYGTDPDAVEVPEDD